MKKTLGLDRAGAAELASLRGQIEIGGSELARTRAELVETRADLASLREWLTGITDRIERTGAQSDWLQERLDALQRRLESDVSAMGGELSSLGRLIPTPTELGSELLGLEPFTLPDGDVVTGFRGGGTADRGLYVGFEDVFRGPEREIENRQRPYLRVLTGHTPVLDVGCGRGELLGLLREAGLPARGVDLDAEMVARCHEKGLDVEVGDAISALESSPKHGLGAVVAAQVIEHLPYAALLRFFAALITALTPGGVAVLETVNPHNPQALKHFWIDPSHQHPLFPEVVLSMLQLHGFREAYIWYPLGSGDVGRDRSEQPDYVIVATAPS